MMSCHVDKSVRWLGMRLHFYCRISNGKGNRLAIAAIDNYDKVPLSEWLPVCYRLCLLT